MTTQATHTPGPWEVVAHQENGVVVAVRDGGTVRTVALCADSSTWIPDDQARINASLIAAAPDLLAALEDAVSLISYISGRKYQPALDAAAAVIRKAKGESQ